MAGPGGPVTSSRSTGTGGCSNIPGDSWSVFANPAALAGITNPGLGFMCLGDYLLPELTTGCFSFYIPTLTGNFGTGAWTRGSRYYNETFAALAYSKNIGNSVYTGISFNYLHFHHTDNCRSARLIVPSAGIILLPQRSLSLSFYIFNPVNQKTTGSNDYSIPGRIIACGFSYRMGEEALFCSEIMARAGRRTSYLAGFEFYVTRVFTLRTGISFAYYAEPAAGIGIKSGITEIDIGLRRHPVLGFSPSVSIQLDLSRIVKTGKIPGDENDKRLR